MRKSNFRVQYGGGGSLSIPPNSLIIKHFGFLKRLHNVLLRKKFQKAILLIREASDDEIQTLAEMAFNALKGQYPERVTTLREKLKSYRGLMRKLSDEKVTIGAKRQKIIQSFRAKMKRQQQGGAFPLLPLLAPVIGSLLSALIPRSL